MNSAREYAATYESGYRTFSRSACVCAPVCVCVLRDSTTVDREAVKEKAERAWILIYGTLFWTARSDCLFSHKAEKTHKQMFLGRSLYFLILPAHFFSFLILIFKKKNRVHTGLH